MLESQKKSVNTVIDATWFPLISNMRERSARSKDIKGKGQTLTAHFWLSWQVDCHTSDRGCWWPMPSPARKKLSWDEILWNWGGSHSPHGFRCFYHAFIIFYRFIIIFSIKNIIKMAQWRWMLARLSCDHFQPGLQRQLLWLCAPDEPLDHARFIQLMNIYVESGENRWWAIHMDNISIYLSLSLSVSLCAHMTHMYRYIYIQYTYLFWCTWLPVTKRGMVQIPTQAQRFSDRPGMPRKLFQFFKSSCMTWEWRMFLQRSHENFGNSCRCRWDDFPSGKLT